VAADASEASAAVLSLNSARFVDNDRKYVLLRKNVVHFTVQKEVDFYAA